MPGVIRTARAASGGASIMLIIPRALADQYGIKAGTKLEITPYMANSFIVQVKS